MSKIEVKQIIVVTDGKSNIGGNPITAAAEAARKHITVSAVGIMGSGESNDASLYELEKIAQVGKGVWENTYISNLGYTMCAVTQKTVNKTIQTIVQNQLKEMMGGGLEDIPPKSRSKVVEYIEQLGEEADIQCCIVMDCSGSMVNKMDAARQSIIELMNSLKGRSGKSRIAVIAYPGEKGEYSKKISDFTEDVQELKKRIFQLKAGGTTPTAAAINRAVCLFCGEEENELEQMIKNNQPLLKENMV